ncbi:hypothetical protein, partial [Phocaeicola vulgatus]|uniref:hypothetical protein n=1 Tax=Phocaeicola vulgatus TaxID=821 RepID=UPI0034A240CC
YQTLAKENHISSQLHQFSSLKQEIQPTTTRTGIPLCRLYAEKREQTISAGYKNFRHYISFRISKM